MRNRRRTRAFTLVELLVVIGIIAALIGILLPVLSGVSSRGRDLKCQSNLRTIGQMIMTYAAENKGSLPYGYYYNTADPVTFEDRGDGRLTTLWSVLSRLSGKQYRGDDKFVDDSGSPNPEAKQNGAPFLRCPEAELVLEHICSYSAQFVAFCTPWDEWRASNGRAFQTKPAKLGDLFGGFTILAHDTHLHPGMNNDVGYVTNADVDGQRMWTDRPQRRYYSIKDPYGRIPPGIFGQERFISFAGSGSNVWKNIDPPASTPYGFSHFPFQGNIRFRHNKDTSCNVLYADGRVESIRAKFNTDKTMASHPIKRKSIQTKWPSGQGLVPHPSEPF